MVLTGLRLVYSSKWGYIATNIFNRTITYPISINTPFCFTVTLVRHDTEQNYVGVQASGNTDDGNISPKIYNSYAQIWNEHNSAVYWILIAK